MAHMYVLVLLMCVCVCMYVHTHTHRQAKEPFLTRPIVLGILRMRDKCEDCSTSAAFVKKNVSWWNRTFG